MPIPERRVIFLYIFIVSLQQYIIDYLNNDDNTLSYQMKLYRELI